MLQINQATKMQVATDCCIILVSNSANFKNIPDNMKLFRGLQDVAPCAEDRPKDNEQRLDDLVRRQCIGSAVNHQVIVV
jgi:hypothetical protein